MHGGLMVCGTGSDVGKSQLVAGLCRLLARKGISVAPFKAQNMALNSFVTAEGAEIGRAQAMQAMAAGVEPEAAMNPILLKPSNDRHSQVILNGRPFGTYSAVEYHDLKPKLLGEVMTALADLRRRFDVVIIEGAGSASEINLLSHDIVNLRIAIEADLPAVVVGDIDRGGVFAALYGTWALLPEDHAERIKGFIINKFRGDPALLDGGTAELEARTGVSTLGIIPMLADLHIDAEDSMALGQVGPRPGQAVADPLDIAVLRLPRISNFTDLDALALEPGVNVRFVTSPNQLAGADLIIIPGSKATVSDLAWLRQSGLAEAIKTCEQIVLGICAGYQMLGRAISDNVESEGSEVDGLGLLNVTTRFVEEKVTAQRRGTALGHPVAGYEIHHGITEQGGDEPWLYLDSDEGAVSHDGRVRGTSLHGLFESDGFRAAFLRWVAAANNKRFEPAGVSFQAQRHAQFDRLADALEAHLDISAIERLIASA